jgi:hypothetical protein
MNIRMHHTDIGDGYLTTEHSASSYGQPVFVADSGTAYAPGDKYPRYNCNTGYLHQVGDVEYTAEEIQWVHDYIVRTHLDGVRRHSDEGINSRNLVWMFGTSWVTAEQLAEIERRNGERMVLNG